MGPLKCTYLSTLGFYIAHRQRDNKMGVWPKTTSFMALLWWASPFMQERKVQRLQFHSLLHRPGEDLTTVNLRMRDHENENRIVNCRYYNKLWEL